MENTVNKKFGTVYRLYVDDPPWFYIGSTTQKSLKSRRLGHKQRAQLCPDNKMYKILNEIGWDKVKIEVVEELFVYDKTELYNKENEHIVTNFNNPYLLNKQYSSTNMTNFETFNKYPDANRSKASNTTRTKYIQQQQEYRNKTKEHKSEYDKEYRERKSDYIQERRKTKIQCQCGSMVTLSHIARHKKSLNHQSHSSDNVNTFLPIFSDQNQESHSSAST